MSWCPCGQASVCVTVLWHSCHRVSGSRCCGTRVTGCLRGSRCRGTRVTGRLCIMVLWHLCQRASVCKGNQDRRCTPCQQGGQQESMGVACVVGSHAGCGLWEGGRNLQVMRVMGNHAGCGGGWGHGLSHGGPADAPTRIGKNDPGHPVCLLPTWTAPREPGRLAPNQRRHRWFSR